MVDRCINFEINKYYVKTNLRRRKKKLQKLLVADEKKSCWSGSKFRRSSSTSMTPSSADDLCLATFFRSVSGSAFFVFISPSA
ncbi:hypothetical protein L1987_63604 [Smallanthus sonchifolius]|uniref:Uncharacterized protein n=1 Tax=Smallanthus sonchifolius TaxID=185202 RepID=A0ACB9CDQ3_9ASTR|nr:hypothetical protein L1987_63604 [Smallanthus sonchifolius]